VHSVLQHRPHEQLLCRFLKSLPTGLPEFKISHILQTLRSIAPEPVWQSVFKLPLIYEKWREEGAMAFRPWQGCQVIFDHAVVYEVVGVDDKSLRRENVVLVDVSCDDDRSVEVRLVFYIEETVSNWAFTLHLAEKVEVVLD
jgi:hypothetical protein